MTPIPPLDRTSATFRTDVDTFFGSRIPTFTVELNALALDLTTKQGLASQAALDADADRIVVAADKVIVAGHKDTAQFAADAAVGYRNQAQSWAGAAAAAAAAIGTAVAFSDANPVVKNAADNSKQLRFNLANFTPGVQRVHTPQNRDGTQALTDDPDIVRPKKYFDAGANLTLNYNDGIHQRWAPGSGSKTLVISNWPAAGEHAELMIEGIGLAGATITWPTYIWWLRYDGTYAQAFSYTLAALQGGTASDFIVLWTREGSTRVFGKVVR